MTLVISSYFLYGIVGGLGVALLIKLVVESLSLAFSIGGRLTLQTYMDGLGVMLMLFGLAGGVFGLLIENI